MSFSLAAIALVPGLAFGSFLNVVAARVPREALDRVAGIGVHELRHGARVVRQPPGRSPPPAARTLPRLWNVDRPGIPARRASGALLVAACVLVFGFTGDAFVASLFCLALVTVSATDLSHRIVPNWSCCRRRLSCSLRRPRSTRRGVGAGRLRCLLLSLLAALAYPKGMGMGDVKLALLLGAMLGRTVPVAMMIGMIAALVPSIVLFARHGGRAQDGDSLRPVPRARRHRRVVLRRRSGRRLSDVLLGAPCLEGSAHDALRSRKA